MVDRHLPVRLQREVLIRKGERRVERAARQVIENALALADKAFDRATATFDNAVLQSTDVDLAPLLDTIGGIHNQAAQEQADATGVTLLARADPADEYARRALAYLATVHNRLVGTSDAVWEALRAELATGIARGESIANLSLRIDDALAWSGAPNWNARATTIARTETIGAYNNGHLDGAFANQDTFGDAPIYKQWLATGDEQTRETHAEADGQVVTIDETFAVGGDLLDAPGDPAGSPEEVINCRCTMLFLYPGDPDYPGEETGDKYDQALAASPPPAYNASTQEWRHWQNANPEAAFAYRRAQFGATYDTTLSADDMTASIANQMSNSFIDDPNCTNCVTAWDMRMRGFDVMADPMPTSHGQSTFQLMQRWFQGQAETYQSFTPRDYGNVRSGIYDLAVEAINGRAEGDARGFITVQWWSGGSHIFGWTKRAGKVEFWDPQIGAKYTRSSQMWKKVHPGRPMSLIRTDHLPTPTGEGVHAA